MGPAVIFIAQMSSQMRQTPATTCLRDCPDACAIVAERDGDGRLTRLRGDSHHPVTAGFLCQRTTTFLPRLDGPDRLRQPLLRKDGQLTPVGWDEALDVIAERLLAIRAESGPEAIFHYRSGGSLGLVTGAVVDRLFARFGPVTTKSGDICSGAGEAAQELDLGRSESHDLFDLDRSRQIIVWGKNATVSGVHLLPRLKAAQARGVELIAIDPVRTGTVALCDHHIAPRPGGDPALALAVAALWFERGWLAPADAARCEGLDDFRALAASRGAAGWCEQAGLPVAAAERIAQALRDGPCAILVGWGMSRRANGGAAVRLLDALGAISGNLGRPGGGVSFYFGRRTAFDTTLSLPERTPPRQIPEPCFGPAVLEASDPPIRAIWVTAGNPAAMLPDASAVARALETRELTVVVDSFLTDSARRAHVVLPCPTFVEADDIAGAYGHHWLGVARPLSPPPAEVKSDHEIMRLLAPRLGIDDPLIAGETRAFKRALLEGGPTELTLEQLEAGPVRNPLADEVLPPPERVRLPAAVPEPPRPTAEYPLLLAALATRASQSAVWSRPLEGLLPCRVHPSATALPDGAEATLESALGRLAVRVVHDAGVHPEMAVVPKGGHLDAGHCANALVRAALTDLGGGGALYDEPVRLLARTSSSCSP